MTTIRKHHYVLAVPDAAGTAEFFVRQLGFEVVPVDDPGWRFVSRDGLMIMLGSVPPRLHALARSLGSRFGKAWAAS